MILEETKKLKELVEEKRLGTGLTLVKPQKPGKTFIAIDPKAEHFDVWLDIHTNTTYNWRPTGDGEHVEMTDPHHIEDTCAAVQPGKLGFKKGNLEYALNSPLIQFGNIYQADNYYIIEISGMVTKQDVKAFAKAGAKLEGTKLLVPIKRLNTLAKLLKLEKA